jgi:predicted RNA-binding Zn-ribbon protein involved in translation (DUF1610 family)
MIHYAKKKKSKYYMECGTEKIEVEDPYSIKECPICGESLFIIPKKEKRRKRKKSTS